MARIFNMGLLKSPHMEQCWMEMWLTPELRSTGTLNDLWLQHDGTPLTSA
jgi:hypothetical protein